MPPRQARTARSRQSSIFESPPILDDELHKLLTERQEILDEISGLRDDERPLTKKAKAMIEAKELPEGEHRCGEFRISVKTSPAREVSFKTEKKLTIRIKAPDVEE